MRIVLQRVSAASVKVDQQIVGEIEQGLLLLVGIGPNDTAEEVDYLARKCVQLRIFEDENGKMNRSLLDVQGHILAVSQFTLFADCRKGRRPSFTNAAPPALGQHLFNQFVERLRQEEIVVETGVFGAHMEVNLCNNGPVTIWLDSEEMHR